MTTDMPGNSQAASLVGWMFVDPSGKTIARGTGLSGDFSYTPPGDGSGGDDKLLAWADDNPGQQAPDPQRGAAQAGPGGALGIVANVVNSGTVDGHDAGVVNPFPTQPPAAPPPGPFLMGAIRWQYNDLDLIMPEIGKAYAPGLKVDEVIQDGTRPTDPNHTFPADKQHYLANYQMYRYTIQTKFNKAFWVLRPYALTFDYPSNQPGQPYKYSIREKQKVSEGM